MGSAARWRADISCYNELDPLRTVRRRSIDALRAAFAPDGPLAYDAGFVTLVLRVIVCISLATRRNKRAALFV